MGARNAACTVLRAPLKGDFMNQDFKVCKKIDDKYQTFGSVKKNKWDRYGLGLRCTAQFKMMIADTPEGDWINFNLFADDKKK